VEHATSQGAAHLTGQPGFTRSDDNGTITRTLWVPDTPSVGADQARCTRILVLMFRILYRFRTQLAHVAARSGHSKDLEIIVLRHQIIVLRRRAEQPHVTDDDRTLLRAIAAALPRPRRTGWIITPDTGPNFLRSQAAVACDFATVDTALLRRYHPLFFIDVTTRDVFFAGISANPTGAWTTQAARNLLSARRPAQRIAGSRS
jgi:hypothetical protein